LLLVMLQLLPLKMLVLHLLTFKLQLLTGMELCCCCPGVDCSVYRRQHRR
jgi:hypothetical protein